MQLQVIPVEDCMLLVHSVYTYSSSSTGNNKLKKTYIESHSKCNKLALELIINYIANEIERHLAMQYMNRVK